MIIKIGGQKFDTANKEDIAKYILYIETHSKLYNKLNEKQRKEVIKEIFDGLTNIEIQVLNTIKENEIN